MKYRVHIIKADAADDLIFNLTPNSDIEALDHVRDEKDSGDDGWRMVPGQESDCEIDADGNVIDIESQMSLYTPRSGSTLQLITKTGVTNPADMTAAIAAINALNVGERFRLIDEHPTLKPSTKIIFDRPSLLKDPTEAHWNHGKPNGHSRTGDYIY